MACNGDKSLAVIDTTNNKLIKQIPVGYLPYGVTVSRDGSKVLVSNWGVKEYKFLGAHYDGAAILTSLDSSPPARTPAACSSCRSPARPAPTRRPPPSR